MADDPTDIPTPATHETECIPALCPWPSLDGPAEWMADQHLSKHRCIEQFPHEKGMQKLRRIGSSADKTAVINPPRMVTRSTRPVDSLEIAPCNSKFDTVKVERVANHLLDQTGK